MKTLVLILKIALPLLIVAAAIYGAMAMIAAKPEVKTKKPEVLPPQVRVQKVHLEDRLFKVHSQGTVSPRTESQLVPETSGRVESIADSFVPGGFFEAGDVLIEIDSHDYELAVAQARAEVARMGLVLAREEAETEVARKEWDELGKGKATPLTLREPQLADARASLAAAEAALERAQRDLDRTKIRAPFAGRVRQKNVDVGQFIVRGNPVGIVYAVDYVEIRLPLADDDLAFIDLPLDYRGETNESPGPRVTLRADFAGRNHAWEGRIVRTEGEIDTLSRLVHAVARVTDPYGRGEVADRPPLAVGLYVRAEIDGRRAKDVAVLPRAALRASGQVLVVDDDERLRFRDVVVLRKTRDAIVVGTGLAVGERVCVSPLEAVTEGMKVRVAGPATSGEEL